uniref:Nucleolar protein 6 n=1 Tax=Biomphalaria glabrata TaxID=6526 RepID=A0A2C9LX97_BIOGL
MKRKLTTEENVQTPLSNDITDQVSSKNIKKAKNKNHDFSTEEIQRLKETEALFHSSLFRLQVTELLKEVSVNQNFNSSVKECITKLQDILTSLPAGKTHKIADKEWLQSLGIQIPFLEKPERVKGSFQFLPPTEVRLTGSMTLDTIVKPNLIVDLVLQMPKACFEPKDYLNQRYVRKRALYLCVVASHLSKNKQIEDLKFTYMMSNPYKPVLLLTIKVTEKRKLQFRLLLEPEENIFKLSRFELSKNNVRPNWFLGKDSESKEDFLPATPFYNSSILNDLTLKVNDQFIADVLKDSEGVRDGIILLKVWFRQRELLTGFGSFSSFILTAYVASLIMLKKINKMMNSYQVFRTTILHLSKADWIAEPPTLSEGISPRVFPTTDEYGGATSCVFVDRTGFYNMAYMISSSIFARVKDEAALALTTLDQHHSSSFDVLFMTPVSFARKFDHVFHITTSSAVKECMSSKINEFTSRDIDFAGHSNIVVSHYILQILLKALEKRVSLVQQESCTCPEWKISEKAFNFDSIRLLTFGLVLNVSNAFNVLDKGPPADLTEAKEFREFWGEKSEIRRFKDGTIHEAVLWSESSKQSDRRLVCKKIVQHILSKHYGISKDSVQYMEGKLDSLLHLNVSSKEARDEYGTGEEQSLSVLRSFEELNRVIRALSSIPLAIHSVSGIHPVFRHTEVFPALTAANVTKEMDVEKNHIVPKEGKPLPQFVPPLDVICMLESSGKWPEDVDAIQHMKTLFHIKIGNELKEKHFYSVSIHSSHVDVLKDGYVFRIKIVNTKELAVLRTHKTDDGMVKFRETDESLALEREIIALPYITSLLHGIQQENPAFSSTVRLCKRWIAAQMVWDFLPEIVIELLVAYIFISPYPYTAPGSPCNGFFRFLHLLSTFNWKTDPLMINLNKEFTEEDFSTIPKEFTKHRATLPCMCLVTPQDKQGTKWTRPNPTEPFLQRLIVLARESLKIVEAQVMLQTASADFKLIFRPPLGHYDLIIRLLKKVNVNRYQAVDAKKDVCVNLPDKSQKQPIPLVGFNPVRLFVQDLRSVFGDFAMFFHDTFGGDVIGVVWKSQAFEKKDFATSHFNYRKPSVNKDETVSLMTEKECILEDIRVIGGGIVESITVPSEA